MWFFQEIELIRTQNHYSNETGRFVVQNAHTFGLTDFFFFQKNIFQTHERNVLMYVFLHRTPNADWTKFKSESMQAGKQAYAQHSTAVWSIDIWMLGQVSVNDVWDSSASKRRGIVHSTPALRIATHSAEYGQSASERRRNGVIFRLQPHAISMVLGVR